MASAARNYSDQMLATSHTLSSFSVKMTDFSFLAVVSVTLSTLPYYLHIHRTGNNYCPWLHIHAKSVERLMKVTRQGCDKVWFQDITNKKKGGRRGKVKREAVMDVINELRCSAPSFSLFHCTPVLAIKQALCCHCLIQFACKPSADHLIKTLEGGKCSTIVKLTCETFPAFPFFRAYCYFLL